MRRRGCSSGSRSSAAQISHVEFGDDRTVDVVLRASRRSESARVAEKVNELADVEHVQWRP